MRISRYMSTWLAVRAPGLAPRTVDSYRQIIDQHIIPQLGNCKLRSLSPARIAPVLAAIAAQHGRTAELVYTLLRAALADAVRDGLLDRSPMDSIRRPRHDAQMRRWLSTDELPAYVAAAQRDRLGLAWMLALCCGLRRGELCGLRWSDVDLTAMQLHVRNQRQRLEDGRIIDAPPKSSAGVRDVPIPDALRASLQIAWQPRGYVVTHEGHPYTPSGLDQAHRAMLVANGLPPITLHGLRHSMASAAVSGGVHVRVLQQLLGHASYTTTARVYAHVDQSAATAAIDTIADRVLSYSQPPIAPDS